MSWPLTENGHGLINWSGSFKYFPSTMQASSIPLRDTEGVIEAYKWLNNNIDKDSSLLVHDTFEFWTLLYLNRNHVAYLFDNNLEAAINSAVTAGFQSIYFVWWNQDIGWHKLELSNEWLSVHDSGRISVYKIDYHKRPHPRPLLCNYWFIGDSSVSIIHVCKYDSMLTHKTKHHHFI